LTIPFAILNEDGSCPDQYTELLSAEVLRRFLETLLLNRVVDRRFLMLQRQGRLGFYMTSTGEEATTIGTAACLENRDPIFLSYRELGALLWRGVPLDSMLNQFMGNAADLSKGRQMPVHHCYREYHIPSVSSPVGTQLPHACGYAYASKLRKTSQVAIAFCGEGTASQGDVHTALNFSGVFHVPAVFVIRNNGYAISTPESVQTAAPSLACRGQGYGIPGFQVDGNDALAVVNVVGQAVRRARQGEGCTLIEALTYRMGAHSTSDDPTAYRSDEERAHWEKLDPLRRLSAHGVWRGLWSEEEEHELEREYEAQVSELIARCEALPPPSLPSLFEDVYAECPPHLAAQRDAYLGFIEAQRHEEYDV